MPLASEIGIGSLTWRDALKSLVTGAYAKNVPALDHPKFFARPFNDLLISNGRPPYFYSATKSREYGIPSRDPRSGCQTKWRLCEQYPSIFRTGSPKPFNRVGDNGSVGGQTCVGLSKILELIEICDQKCIPLRCWPFDGTDITSADYEGHHVLIEPYPSAAGAYRKTRSDVDDAIAAALMISQSDLSGTLPKMLDLSSLSDDENRRIKFEGWIAGHLPLFRVPKFE